MPPAPSDKITILSRNLFPVVGIGASAGGLEAFKQLVKAILPDSGMAYILVQHLHPDHESSLPEILQRETPVVVSEIKDNVQVEPDHIYIIPTNKLLVANDGVLQLLPRPPKDQKNFPIDIFFSSLAAVHQHAAIGVILSGTGADGTLGLKSIKDHGGITFAESLDSAAYTGMPESAMNAGVVDFILSPEQIPQQLRTLKNSFDTLSSDDQPLQDGKLGEDHFKQILALIRSRKGVDFTYYKQTTIRRRIIRRAMILTSGKVSGYVDYLKQHKPEQDILFQDLLIPVTSFFRDSSIFDALGKTVLPGIIKANDQLRVWIAGCSTGEEAYSMAICLLEYLSVHDTAVKIQIFATDISEKSITKARSGLYHKKDLADVSEKRLSQFFHKTDGNFQVKKSVRDMCVFACHNFLKDPPFAKIDLISCRNVLIYMQPFLQKKAFSAFHYALNEKGLLLLGKSEIAGSAPDLFTPSDKKNKLFIRNSVPRRFSFAENAYQESAFKDHQYPSWNRESGSEDFQKKADEILLSKYTPAGVIVNEHLDIVQFRGSTGAYLEPSPGKASLNVIKMARNGLSFELRSALHKSKATNEPSIKEGIPVNNGERLVTLEVIPLLNAAEPYFLILFKDTPSPPLPKEAISGTDSLLAEKIKAGPEYLRIQALEKELAQAREDMRNITEDQEAANKELQNANEELLSSAEEMQSLNEELETSKEELQSTNEELMTINHELYDSKEQFNEARIYAEAIVSTIHEPLLVINRHFLIKSANEAFYKAFQLTEEETLGKNLFELQDGHWSILALRKELLGVWKGTEKVADIEITHHFPSIGMRTICFNAGAMINGDNGEKLVLLALDDITIRKNAAQVLEERANEVLKERTLLKIAEKKKDEFISIASHEMKTPLTTAKAFLQLLESTMDNTNERAKIYTKKALLSVNRLISLTSELLDVSKIQQGKLNFHYTVFDFNAMLNEAIEGVQYPSPKHTIVKTGEIAPQVSGDKDRLQQVVINLLDNAVKYSPGADKVFINTALENGEIKVSVTDTGIGIAAHNINRIFERYYRVADPNLHLQGLGIGLFISWEIIQHHKGELWVESDPGKGSTFYFTLPVQP